MHRALRCLDRGGCSGTSNCASRPASLSRIGVSANGFLSIRPVEKIDLGLDVDNLFDKLGSRGGGGLFPILSSTRAVFNNTALYGRTVTGSIRYRF